MTILKLADGTEIKQGKRLNYMVVFGNVPKRTTNNPHGIREPKEHYLNN